MEQEKPYKVLTYKRIEFWIATIIFGGYLFFKLLESRNDGQYVPTAFTENHIRFNYFKNDFIPALIKAIAYYFAFIVVSKYINLTLAKRRVFWNSCWFIIIISAALAVVVSITNTYINGWIFANFSLNAAYNYFFFNGFVNTSILTFLFVFYHLASRNFTILFGNTKPESQTATRIKTIITCFVLWLFVLVVLTAIPNCPPVIMVLWMVCIPFGLIMVFINLYWLIPAKRKYNKSGLPHLLKMILFSVVLSFFAATALTMGAGISVTGSPFYGWVFFLMAALILSVITWAIYKSYVLKTGQIISLQTALGKSTADLDFLRSQINPHFLFNALNTIYGTALQEHAERTGEAVQMLGDMMRFMLHENVQEQILLSREIEYLNNYISLQKLRTQTSPSIRIETQIEEPVTGLQIAPMLLIPFVENAFKHGISLREASYINITLYTKDSHLHYDVYNSIHLKQHNDPEKEKSGVGLENVKQRLQLLYLQKHELIIRETVKEYFMHLTIQLD